MAPRYPSKADFDALAQPLGRMRAYANLMFADHGIFRPFYNRPKRLSDRMWRSAQPAPFDLKRMRDQGIRTIINLRGSSDQPYYTLEAQACRDLGLHLVDFRLRSRDVPSKSQFHEVQDLFRRIEYPALMHCKSGADRAGLMSALYCMMELGQTPEEALKQLSLKHGHFRQAKTGLLDRVIEAYRDDNARDPVDLMTWVDTAYDPQRLKTEFMTGFWPSFLVDRILRRE